MTMPETRIAMFDVFKQVKARLDEAEVYYETRSYRDDAFSFLVHLPGKYWEIDVLEDGTIDLEMFTSQGMAEDPWSQIEQLVEEQAGIARERLATKE